MATIEELRQQLQAMETKMHLMATLKTSTVMSHEAVEINAVALKLPTFYEDRPD